MNWHDQSKSYPIVIRRVRRKAQVFGTSALELMLVITFVILLLLLAYYSTISSAAEASEQADAGVLQTDRPNELRETISDLERRLDTALAEKRGADMEVARLWKEEDRATRRIRTLENSNSILQQQTRRLRAEVDKIREASDPYLGPPIIRLSEADGYSFATNSSDIRAEFASLLRQSAVPRILEIAAQYRTDTIDIVGHTDERAIAGKSNLDRELVPFLNGRRTRSLRAADNAGLGFARAAAVARILSRVSALRPYRIIPMSGAQVILPRGTISDGADSGDVPDRRRIEIRMRRSDSPS